MSAHASPERSAVIGSIIMLPDRARFSPGWYRLRLQDGFPVGGGLILQDEHGSILQPLGTSRDVAGGVVIVLNAPSDYLVVRSTTCDETAASFGVDRIGKVRAFLMMSRTLASNGYRGLEGGARTLQHMIRFGPAHAASMLVQCYRALLDESPGFVPEVFWRIRHGIGWFARSARLVASRSGQSRVRSSLFLSGWEVTDDRPAFLLLDADGAPLALPAGWYRVSGRSTSSGVPLDPEFRARYEGGDRAVRVKRVADAVGSQGRRFNLLILLAQEARELHFTPATSAREFVIEDVSIRRMTRFEWLPALLYRLRRSDGRYDWKGLWGVISLLATSVHAMSAALDRHFPVEQEFDDSRYQEWVNLHDTVREGEHLQLRSAELSEGPVISLLVPAYRTPEAYLRRCIESVLHQAYPNWELCIVDDASPDGGVADVVAQYAAHDQRIKFLRRPTNGHISAASNSALELASGDFVGLLDHDDELRCHALLEVVQCISRHPDAGLIYSDEDKIDKEGRRFHAYFKPDWNPDLLLSQNYLCHFTVLRTALVRSVGGFRTGFEGSQDHDLFLRCVERLDSHQVRHIPKVLYHWRAIPGSTALDHDVKDYATEAGRKAVAEHLLRTGSGAEVVDASRGHYRIRWPMPLPCPKVSIIIPTRDRVDLLKTCIDSVIERTRYPDYEIIVVDNQSVEPSTKAYFDSVRSHPLVQIMEYDAPFNYSAINNWAVSRANGEVLCLLNNDIEVISEDWLGEMVRHACRDGVGAVGAMLYYPNDTIQHAGVVLGVGGVANHAFLGCPRGCPGHGGRAMVVQNYSAVTGACLVVRREAYERAGGLDEELEVAFNDIDFCLRLRELGYRNLWTPFAELYHHESASRGEEDSEEKLSRFHREVRRMVSRWGPTLLADPAYNPNLSLSMQDGSFALAFPPRLN